VVDRRDRENQQAPDADQRHQAADDDAEPCAAGSRSCGSLPDGLERHDATDDGTNGKRQGRPGQECRTMRDTPPQLRTLDDPPHQHPIDRTGITARGRCFVPCQYLAAVTTLLRHCGISSWQTDMFRLGFGHERVLSDK